MCRSDCVEKMSKGSCNFSCMAFHPSPFFCVFDKHSLEWLPSRMDGHFSILFPLSLEAGKR